MFDSFKSKYSLTFAQLGQKLGSTAKDQEGLAKTPDGAKTTKVRSRQESSSPKHNDVSKTCKSQLVRTGGFSQKSGESQDNNKNTDWAQFTLKDKS